MIILQATTAPTPSISIWTILAALAAILSAVSAFRSSRFAKRALTLAGQTYQDRQANFSLYLIDGYRCTSIGDEKNKLLLFHITISNKSDNKSSFKADLELEYIRADQSVARAIMTHDENLQNNLSDKKLTVFSNDIRIDEKGMASKWLIFEQPKTVSKDFRIEKYTVKITDTHGNTQIVDSIILKELNNV